MEVLNDLMKPIASQLSELLSNVDTATLQKIQTAAALLAVMVDQPAFRKLVPRQLQNIGKQYASMVALLLGAVIDHRNGQ